MKKIIALLLFGILLFGCTLPPLPGTWNNPQAAGNGSQSSPVLNPPPNVTTPAANATPPAQPPVVSPPPVTSDRQRLIGWYVMNKLMGANGAVMKSYGDASYSSESVWMVMEYALETGNRTLFDREFEFLKTRQLDPTYSLAYAELDSSFSPKTMGGRYYAETANDIRIVHMLYDAKDKWGNAGYTNVAKRISDSLLLHAVFTDIFVKEVYWGADAASPSTRMSSAGPDWVVMQRLAAESHGWTSVLERTRSHVLGCQESGLFWPEYNAAGPACDYGQGMGAAKTTGIATAAMALADVNILETAVIMFGKLTNELNQDDRISESYFMQFNGVPSGDENAATYAAVGRLAVKLDRCDSAAKIKDKLLAYFVADTGSPLYGSIAMDGTANAYDNLQALLFLHEYANTCG